MTDNDFVRLAVSLHARTVISLIDAVERATTPAERIERLALIRDAVLDHKHTFNELFKRSTDAAHAPTR